MVQTKFSGNLHLLDDALIALIYNGIGSFSNLPVLYPLSQKRHQSNQPASMIVLANIPPALFLRIRFCYSIHL